MTIHEPVLPIFIDLKSSNVSNAYRKRSFIFYSGNATPRPCRVQRRPLQTQMFPDHGQIHLERALTGTYTHASATEGGRKIASPEVTTALLGLSILLLVRARRHWPRRPRRYLGRPPCLGAPPGASPAAGHSRASGSPSFFFFFSPYTR